MLTVDEDQHDENITALPLKRDTDPFVGSRVYRPSKRTSITLSLETKTWPIAMKKDFIPPLLMLVLVAVIHPIMVAAQPAPANVQQGKDFVKASIEAHAEAYAGIALQIWEWAEVGYQENQSASLLQAELKQAGFTIEAGVAGIPTAFIASYGQGVPVIGILAEYDALPGPDIQRALSQCLSVRVEHYNYWCTGSCTVPFLLTAKVSCSHFSD